MVSNVIKALLLIIVIFIGYFAYQYNYGSMYGGKVYQEKAILSGVKGISKLFYDYQELYKSKNGVYDSSLHLKEPFLNHKTYTFGYSDGDEVVKEKCASCKFSEQEYTIGIYLKQNKNKFFWKFNYKNVLELNISR